MYTKEQASSIRQEFWTILGKYLSPMPSATGNKVNWINYKTGVKNLHYKMEADKQEAIIRIEISGEIDKRIKLYELFLSLRKPAIDLFRSDWVWEKETEDVHGKVISCIYSVKEEVNIFNKEHWPVLISFFKENIVAFDLFWADHKEIFEMIG